MDALNRGPVHERLDQWPRRRQLRNSLAVQLDDEVGTKVAGRVGLEVVGPEGGVHQAEIAPQDAVLLELRDQVELGHAESSLHLTRERSGIRRRRTRGVEASLELGDQGPGHIGEGHQRIGKLGPREPGTALQPVAQVGPQHHHLPPVEAGHGDEPVQRVQVGRAAGDGLDGLDQSRAVDAGNEP